MAEMVSPFISAVSSRTCRSSLGGGASSMRIRDDVALRSNPVGVELAEKLFAVSPGESVPAVKVAV